MNAREIAKGMTQRQREAVLDMPVPPAGLAYQHVAGKTRVSLFSVDVLQYLPTARDAAPKMCLTPIGLEVRAILQEQNNER
jgi:hypothetical protein